LKNLTDINHEANIEDQYLEFSKRYPLEQLEGCISVSSDSPSRPDTIRLINKFPNIHGVFGIHPLYAEQYTSICEQEILQAMSNSKTVAYGEIGLDYHIFEGVDYAQPIEQKKIFEQQMKHAIDVKKPIVIHTREAEEDTFNMMKQYIPKSWKIHVHCYTDSLDFAKKLLSEWDNLYIGFTGVITFKNSKDLQNVAKELPLDKLLLETDGPFMAPIPFRGKTCHPGHIPYIAQQIAELKKVPVEEVYIAARHNTKAMYGI